MKSKTKAEAAPASGQLTPLTDRAEALPIGFYSCATVPADLARSLERENAQLLKTCGQLVNVLEHLNVRQDLLNDEMYRRQIASIVTAAKLLFAVKDARGAAAHAKGGAQ